MTIKLESLKHFEHPSDSMLVYSKPSNAVLSYHCLKWEYTWRNNDFFTKAIGIYQLFMNLFKLGFIDKKADFSTVICQSRYLVFKSIPQLQPFADGWKDMLTRRKSKFEDGINPSIAIKDYLLRKYATLLPKYFHKTIAIIKKISNSLYKQYGYRGLLVDYKTTPWPIDIIIEVAINNGFPYMGDHYDVDSEPTIDVKAIKIYDERRNSLHKYSYDGDVLLSIDFSKTDETIINDIRLLIRQIRRENDIDPVYVDSEEREIKDKTKTKLSLKDYKTRLLGLWLADYKELYECGGAPAIEALRDTGYLERCGIKDNARALMRLIAATERCIAAADVLPITSTH